MKVTLLLNLDTVRELHPVWVITLFFVPLVGGIVLYFYKTRHAKLWRKGIFPPKLKPNEDNFLEAYLALGAKLMIIDYHTSKGKIQFINQYFSRYFRFANYNFSDSLVFSFRHPIKSATVTDWLKKHLPTEGARSQVIYFLTGLGMVNGTLSSKEILFLKQINAELELSPSNLVRILSIYASYHQNKANSEENTATRKKEKGKYAHDILNIPVNADAATVKKAYRKLVKIHHPDNFANASLAQQKMAEEKFIEIQRAYEELIN